MFKSRDPIDKILLNVADSHKDDSPRGWLRGRQIHEVILCCMIKVLSPLLSAGLR